ncbi:MAG: excinuclease ABC subunit UvrA [Pirellulales bacterium]
MSDAILIHGARTHNLQNIDVEIPRNQLVVITGVSGSGKSSLAFDTLLAEGQRQYIESLSVYARQFFDQLERPDVDLIEGLQPAIAIDQGQGSQNPRSTVATITEIYDYLRLLFARCGTMACPNCGTPIAQQTPAEIQSAIEALPAETRVMLLAPIVRGRKGRHADELENVRKAGLVRVRVDGEVYPLEDVPELVPQKAHTIEAVVDRIVLREGIAPRLAESVRLALKHGDGVLAVSYRTPDAEASAWEEKLFNTRYACPHCKTGVGEIEPRTFSFNSPYGACSTCGGLGTVGENSEICPDCCGTRLRPEARACHIAGEAIYEVTARSVSSARDFFASLEFDSDQKLIADPLVREIMRRLEFLDKSGVDYLSLDRPANTLSGGELQRVRLATGIGSGLVGVMYLLDEPSIGLHPRDNDRLIAALRDLQQQGNSVIVVEHDEAMMRAADHLIDVGPGAGIGGGRIVAAGTPDEVANAIGESVTSAFLSGREQLAVPTVRRGVAKSRTLELEGATLHNLQDLSVDFPLGCLVAVTGVSGSGKSSLVMETLTRALSHKLHGALAKPGPYRALCGASQLDRCVEVDQSPIGRTPRSNAATYTGAFDEIRKVFATTKLARQRGYRASRFSFNAKGGRCEECRGQGFKKIEMNFLPDVFVPCPVCHGARFNRQTLAVKYREKSIADVLAMSVDTAVEFFDTYPAIHRQFAALRDVGLGYLALGQPSTTISGGEAQRIKLAAELGGSQAAHTLYVLDEPTTGLHLADIRRLLAVLQKLVDGGNSVLLIEHHLDVIKSADWVIELGPDGGSGGGFLVVAGTPEAVAACAESPTGQFLRRVLPTAP